MAASEDPDDDGADDERRRTVERAHAVAAELRARMSTLAAAVAETEELVARTYEASATVRPHVADRLMEAAVEARTFAAHEREEARRRAVPAAPPAPADDADGPVDPTPGGPAGPT